MGIDTRVPHERPNYKSFESGRNFIMVMFPICIESWLNHVILISEYLSRVARGLGASCSQQFEALRGLICARISQQF